MIPLPFVLNYNTCLLALILLAVFSAHVIALIVCVVILFIKSSRYLEVYKSNNKVVTSYTKEVLNYMDLYKKLQEEQKNQAQKLIDLERELDKLKPRAHLFEPKRIEDINKYYGKQSSYPIQKFKKKK